MQFFILIPAALLVGLMMGLLGSGGSILTLPMLVYLLGLDEKLAIASSLAIVGLIALLTSLWNMRTSTIHWYSVIWFGIPGVFGTYGGAAISEFTSGTVQLMVFSCVMLLSAVSMFKPPNLQPEGGRQKVWIVVLEGLVIGGLTGFVGVGGGFMIVPALVLLGGLSMSVAVATSLVIIAVKSAAGFIKYLDLLQDLQLSVDWTLITVFAAIGMVGSLIGQMLVKKIPQRQAEQVFAVFLVLISGWILSQTIW